jgi:hypothetical protein
MRPGTSTVRRERRPWVLVVRIDRAARRDAIDRVTAHGIDEALSLLFSTAIARLPDSAGIRARHYDF